MLTPTVRPRRKFTEGLPEISTSLLPDAERATGFKLRSAMQSATGYIEKFNDAVALFDYCEAHIAAAVQEIQASPNPPGQVRQYRDATAYARGWQHIAARDAPINLWNFAQMLAEIRSVANGCSTIKSAVNWSEVEGALKDFHVAFPFAWESRVGASHAADIHRNSKRNAATEIQSGSFKVEGGSVVFTDTISGNKAVATVDGQFVECKVSTATVDTMERVLRRLFDAFNVPALCRRPAAAHKEGHATPYSRRTLLKLDGRERTALPHSPKSRHDAAAQNSDHRQAFPITSGNTF